MATRHGPGRPPNPWRPRKIEQDYIDVSEGYHSPETRRVTRHALRAWADYLRKIAVDSDLVTVHHYIAWIRALQADGFTRGMANKAGLVRGFYLLKGSKEPDSKWSKLSGELTAFRLPKVTGKKDPHKPFPLRLLPKILEASRHVKHYSRQSRYGKQEVYSEAHALVATFLYAGGRAQWYSLTDKQVRDALDKKYVELFVKEGEYVFVPIHDRLLEIWKQHLELRDFKGPFFFRHGRNPYTYQEGSRDWREDARAAGSNNQRVEMILHDVQAQLLVDFEADEHVTSHRFRKSVRTYMEQYGFTGAEARLQMSHGAKDITEFYSVPSALEAQRKLSKMDLGSAEWVAAHDPPRNLFAGNGDVDEDLVAQLRAQLQEANDRNARLEKRLDAILERLEPKVVA